MPEKLAEEYMENYADLMERQAFLTESLNRLLEQAIPEEVQKQLEEIKAEYQPMIEQVQAALAYTKERIEQQVLDATTTWKGTRYMAVWNKGRETWDGHALDGFAMAHPEILQAKKIGNPTVTFRQVK